MPTHRRDRRARLGYCLAALGVLASMFVAESLAEPLDLPLEIALGYEPVALALQRATIEIVREPGIEPALRARLRSASGEGATAALRVGMENGMILIGRAGEATAGPPIIVELLLDREQPVKIEGRELEVLIAGDPQPSNRDDENEDGEAEEGRQSAMARRASEVAGEPLAVDVKRSSLQILGVDGATIKAVNSSTYLDRTAGKLSLDIRGGDAEVRGHQGSLEVLGLDAEVWVNEAVGVLSFSFRAGGLEVRGGRGPAKGTCERGRVRFDGRRGPLTFKGSDASVEVLGTEDRSHVNLEGKNLDASVAQFNGQLTATLRSGRLSVTDKTGNNQINATEGAEVTLEQAAGDTVLSLQGSSARLADIVAPKVKVDLRNGRLDAQRLRHLELNAQDADVTVVGLENVGAVQVTDTRLDFDLSEVKKNLNLGLSGASEGFVRLPTPCAVRLSAAQLFAENLDVSGCKLHGQAYRRDRLNQRGLEGNRQVTLTASLTEDSSLEVEGYP